jgi:hypothetical protein
MHAASDVNLPEYASAIITAEDRFVAEGLVVIGGNAEIHARAHSNTVRAFWDVQEQRSQGAYIARIYKDAVNMRRKCL